MTATHSSGPDIIFGIPYDANANSAGANPDAGPCVTYQGDAILDVRFPYQPGITGQGRVPAFLDSPYITMVDAVPAAALGAIAAGAGVSGNPLTLAVAPAAGIAPGVPVLPLGAPSVGAVVSCVGLDMGLVAAATVAASPVITLAAASYPITPGTNLLVQQGAAFTSATVLSVNGLAVTLDTPMGVTAAAALIVAGNGTGQRGVKASYFTPYLTAGAAALFDPTQALQRGIAIVSNNAADVGWSVKISGYDLFGAPMSEIIAMTANGTSFGRKTFKFVSSAVPSKAGGGATAGTIAVGTSDVFGFPIRSDKWEYMNCYWGGAFLTVSTGYLPADPTVPATSVTGDVRGTLQLSAFGQSGTFAAGGAPNGVRRLALFQTLQGASLVAATPMNPAPLYGVAQA